jgi:hypothetical protein
MAHIYLMGNSPQCCTILVWIAVCWNLQIFYSRAVIVDSPAFFIFGDRFGEKDCGLFPYGTTILPKK